MAKSDQRIRVTTLGFEPLSFRVRAGNSKRTNWIYLKYFSKKLCSSLICNQKRTPFKVAQGHYYHYHHSHIVSALLHIIKKWQQIVWWYMASFGHLRITKEAKQCRINLAANPSHCEILYKIVNHSPNGSLVP